MDSMAEAALKSYKRSQEALMGLSILIDEELTQADMIIQQ